MARHTASSHGDTPILTQTWFSHLNDYASTYAQYPNGYSNLVFPSSLAEVQGPAQAAEGNIRNNIFFLLFSFALAVAFFSRSRFATVTSICA